MYKPDSKFDAKVVVLTVERMTEKLWALGWTNPSVVPYQELIGYKHECGGFSHGCPACSVQETIKEAKWIVENYDK